MFSEQREKGIHIIRGLHHVLNPFVNASNHRMVVWFGLALDRTAMSFGEATSSTCRDCKRRRLVIVVNSTWCMDYSSSSISHHLAQRLPPSRRRCLGGSRGLESSITTSTHQPYRFLPTVLNAKPTPAGERTTTSATRV